MAATKARTLAPNIRLLPTPRREPCKDTIDALRQLYEAALSGHVAGIAFVAFVPGQPTLTDFTGEYSRDPEKARGAVCSLDDELADILRDRAD